ncbi:MAG: nucleotidyltransferase domain-containing protein [Acidobacteriota bacterium]|nr:nucleotidyltransferase domain-containing protein [Acidobacteriota bacterium]
MPPLAIEIDKDKLRDFCRRWKITEFALFGSAVRPGEFRRDSDVDVLLSYADDAGWSLFDHVQMRDELCSIFGRDVDLLTRRAVEHSMNPYRQRAILSSAVPLDLT